MPSLLPSLLKYSALCASIVSALLCYPFPNQVQAAPYSVKEMDSGKPASVKMDTLAEQPQDAVVISQKNRAFNPSSVTILAHRRIIINNDDDTVHHAYCSSSDFKYNSGAQPIGSSVTIMFPKPGIFELRCAVHPQMVLTVTVVPLVK